MERQPDANVVHPDYWNFSEVSEALNELVTALPMVRDHWDRVADCDDAFSARSALADLDRALAAASKFIEYPFGEYAKLGHRKKPKEWHMPATLILRWVSDAFATVKEGDIKFSRNSPTVKITRLALERVGYGSVTHGAIAKYAERCNARFGGTMNTNGG